MNKSIIYIGDFKDLIPKGWIFQKLFARNYRCYRKEFKGSDILWIWQKRRELEINDLSCHSAWLLNKIITGEYKKWEEVPNSYRVRHDRLYTFNKEIVDYLLQMYLEGLIKIQ